MTQHAKWLAFARTVRGQIVLMAICYGIFALASCLVVSFRAEWIEPSVREIFPAETKLPRVKEQQELARRIAEGAAKPARLADLSAADRLTIYGVAVDEEDVDTNHLLTDALWQEQPEEMILRIERTIVVGNQRQRLRALEILGRIPPLSNVAEARRLCRFALDKAEHQHDEDVAVSAATRLEQLNRPPFNESATDERR